jgi:nucleoside-diphosphate-sugar epimerase
VKIAVTGATGNVGTSVIEALSADESVEEVVAIARRVPRTLPPPKVRWQRADVTESELEPLFAGAAAVIHLAWLIQPSRDERVTRRVNVEGSRRVFDATAKAGVPALVYASSVGAYSPGPAGEAVDESWPVNGVQSSFYARHKAETERLLDELEAAQPRLRVVRLRPGLCFKAGAATGIRRLFIGPLLPGALLRRQWLKVLPFPSGLRTQAVHSDDVAQAYRLAALSGEHGAFNVAAEPVLDRATVARALGARAIPLPAAAVRAAAEASWRLRLQPTSPDWLDMGIGTPIMDTTRARELLGWEPRHTAEQALLELIDGIRHGAEQDTPPLARASSGPLRAREFAGRVGGADGAARSGETR